MAYIDDSSYKASDQVSFWHENESKNWSGEFHLGPTNAELDLGTNGVGWMNGRG